MGGGSHRGPVAPIRQRRTIRVIQALLVVIAAGLLMFAGYSLGEAEGYDRAEEAESFDAPRSPSIVQTVVLGALGIGALGAAVLLQGSGVRLPTPARLEELAGRAEAAVAERAES
jgi:TRAP-type C4-dicarboxylate transport system permease small subunit